MENTTSPTILYECRRFIYDDRDAEEIAVEIAVDIQTRGVCLENIRRHIYDYLVKHWDRIPEWDDPAFIQVVEALVNPTDPKVAGFEAARIAYERLDYPEQNLLKFKGVEGLSNQVIAQILRTPVDQVTRDADAVKRTFWQLFTRERWSTLPYFLEVLCGEVDSPEILKVEAEYQAARAAYDALDERDRVVLRQRCLEGRSVEEIAAKHGTSRVEVFDILTEARAEFYAEFLSKIYTEIHKKTPIKIRENRDDINDVTDYSHDAWKELCETLYKFRPENFRGWVRTTALRSGQGSVKKDERRGQIIKERGRLFFTGSDGEPDRVLSTDAKPLLPDEALEKDALEKDELRRLVLARKRWFDLLTMTAEAILGSKKPEKKLYVFVHYIFQPVLNQLWGGVKARGLDECQRPGEAMAIVHVLDKYRSKTTQAEIGDIIGVTDRSLRNYIDEIGSLMKKYATAVGIAEAELLTVLPI